MKLKDILKGIAPTLATALGGPFAGMAVNALMKGVTGKSDGTEEELIEAITMGGPDALVRVKEIDKEFKVRMRELDIDLERLEVQDRSSARDMAKHTGFWPQVILTTIFVVGYLATLNAFMDGAVEVVEDHVSVFYAIIGVLTSSVVQIMNFWFGSSKSSQRKDDMMINGHKS